jgi:hypothetical protein
VIVIEGIQVPGSHHHLITPGVAAHLRRIALGPVGYPTRGTFKLVYDLHNGRVARVYRLISYSGEHPEHPDNVLVPEQAPVLERDLIDGIQIDQMENVRRGTDLVRYHIEARLAGRDQKWVNATARNCGIDSRGGHVIIDGPVQKQWQGEFGRYAVVDPEGLFIRWLAVATINGRKRYFTFNQDKTTWSDNPGERRLFHGPLESVTEMPVGYINSSFLYWCQEPWPKNSANFAQLTRAAAQAPRVVA